MRPCNIGGFNKHNLLFSGNTGTYAIELAIKLGFTSIRLLGIDLCDYDKRNSHAFGDGKKEGCKLGNLTIILDVLKRVDKDARSRGVEIVNESPNKGPLDGIFPRRISKWLKKT